MKSVLIILLFFPFILSFFTASFLGRKYLDLRSRKAPYSVGYLLSKISVRVESFRLNYKGSRWIRIPDQKAQFICLPADFEKSNSFSHIARSFMTIGYARLSEKGHHSLIRWRSSMMNLGYILPAFTLLIVLCSVFSRLPIVYGLYIATMVLSLCSILLWLSFRVEKEAVKEAIYLIEELRVCQTLEEEEELIDLLRSFSAMSLLPGAFHKILLK